jgi:hypothetical protein
VDQPGHARRKADKNTLLLLIDSPAALQEAQGSEDEESTQLHPLLDASNTNDDGLLRSQSPIYAEAKGIVAAERRVAPIGTILALTALFAWLVVSDLMKDHVTCGGVVFWTCMLSIVPVVGVMMVLVRKRLICKDIVKAAVRYTHSCFLHGI